MLNLKECGFLMNDILFGLQRSCECVCACVYMCYYDQRQKTKYVYSYTIYTT